MISSTEDDRGTLVLLSSALPDEDGNGEQRQLWSLLNLVSRTYRVTVASMTDEPVNLAQWRKVALLAERVELVPPESGWSRLARRMTCWMLGKSSRQTQDVVFDPRRCECLRRRFDAALCASPRLWSALAQLRADVRLCDVRQLSRREASDVAEVAQVILASPEQAAALRKQAGARVVTILDTTPVSARRNATIAHQRATLVRTDADADTPNPPIQVVWRVPAIDTVRAAA